MSEKRRNLLILGVVVALVAGCAALMTVRSFRLGLDLRGGLEVVLDARPLPGQQVTQADLDASRSILAKGVGSWALFDAQHRQLGKVEPQKSQVLQDYNPQNPVQPMDSQFLAIPKGTEVVSCDPSVGCPGQPPGAKGTLYYLFDLNQNER